MGGGGAVWEGVGGDEAWFNGRGRIPNPVGRVGGTELRVGRRGFMGGLTFTVTNLDLSFGTVEGEREMKETNRSAVDGAEVAAPEEETGTAATEVVGREGIGGEGTVGLGEER